MSHVNKFLIAYDIADSKRLRRVFRIVSDYATPIQYSVFEAQLSQQDLQALLQALTKVIDAQSDRVRCYQLSAHALYAELGNVQGEDVVFV